MRNPIDSRTILERWAIVGDSPVGEIDRTLRFLDPSTAGHVQPCRNPCRPRHKAKYDFVTDSELVP